MKITKAEFIKGATSARQWPADDWPQIAFAGRSNVGKSSLINALLVRKNLAIVSKTPGRTRQINFFLINDAFYFVDLPGYGYARVSKQEKKKWGKMIEDYLQNSPRLNGLVLILDIRRTPTDDDCQMLEWCAHFKVPLILALTKCDKVSGNVRARQIKKIGDSIALWIGDADIPLIPFSAKTGRGRSEILDLLDEWVSP